VRLYSYVVAHDFGFAPNPFYGICTLATCKPGIRNGAKLGDYVIGTGCTRHKSSGRLIYFMRVEKIEVFDEYWADPNFELKRPFLSGSKMRAFGDNIYHRDPTTEEWVQASSFHSQPDGRPHAQNIQHDTQSERVLIGSNFAYWGCSAPQIPPQFRNYDGDDICKQGQGYRVNFVPGLADAFVAWMQNLNQHGYIGQPQDWPRAVVNRHRKSFLGRPIATAK
jgi:hypothetical protein